MSARVVIVSSPQDVHAVRVMEQLAAMGVSAALLDMSRVPAAATLSVDYASPGEARVDWGDRELGGLELTAARAVWWRRPQSCDLSAVSDPAAYAFAHNEWHEALWGIWLLSDQARWINDPVADQRASRKAFQLREAARVGFEVPRTLITSDPERARSFAEQIGVERTIYKTFSALPTAWRETRILRREELELLDDLRFAPMIFQEFVPAEADLRVTVIGDALFPAAIRGRPGDYEADFRVQLGDIPIEPTSLPEDVADKLRRLVSGLGLVYGAVDLRRTPEGRHVFLEVNTAGQFLFVEEATGQPIARALAAALAADP